MEGASAWTVEPYHAVIRYLKRLSDSQRQTLLLPSPLCWTNPFRTGWEERAAAATAFRGCASGVFFPITDIIFFVQADKSKVYLC